MSAIYGANGAGKSNLLKCVALLKKMVDSDKLGDLNLRDDLFFKLNGHGSDKPSELAVEFFTNDKIFYYHIMFKDMKVVEEELSLSGKTKDSPIFSRKDNKVEISKEFFASEAASLNVFADGISRIIRSDMVCLSFLGRYYPSELPITKTAFDWFSNIEIIVPEMSNKNIPYLLDRDANFSALVNSIIPELNTGISRLNVEKNVITEDDCRQNSEMNKAYIDAKNNPGKPQPVETPGSTINIVMENGIATEIYISAVHKSSSGEEVKMDLIEESEGTRRLIEYMVVLYCIIKKHKVYVVDEIERSIHPILIKNIISKISESTDAMGQLIFTTHESCLLDQSIFRPDEIWFAQKDINQSTQLYPLSDYNIHKTANIENGYLNGRYGGIPFLSNLSDLKW
jgi:hypothetical protein